MSTCTASGTRSRGIGLSRNYEFHVPENTFADIKFHSAAVLELWKNTRMGLTHLRTIHIPGWFIVLRTLPPRIQNRVAGFTRVVRLEVHSNPAKLSDPAVSLVPFHGFLPVLRYLHVLFSIFPHSCVFGYIFPSLHWGPDTGH